MWNLKTSSELCQNRKCLQLYCAQIQQMELITVWGEQKVVSQSLCFCSDLQTGPLDWVLEPGRVWTAVSKAAAGRRSHWVGLSLSWCNTGSQLASASNTSTPQSDISQTEDITTTASSTNKPGVFSTKKVKSVHHQLKPFAWHYRTLNICLLHCTEWLTTYSTIVTTDCL